MSHSKLAQAAVKGAIWNYLTFTLGSGIVFVSTVVLARLLQPKEFGLMALALVVINYLKRLQSLGIGNALIYRQEKSEHTANIAFALSVFAGFLFTVITCLSAPYIAAFFHEPQLIPIVQVLSVWFIVINLGSIHEASLRKALDFRRRLIPKTGQRIVKGGTAIILALTGFGVWSLVWGQLAGAIAVTTLFWYVNPWRPHLAFDVKIARSLMGYGSKSIFVFFLQGLFTNIDYLIIGRRMNTVKLGFYTIAFRLPEIILEGIQSSVVTAVFPAYVRVQQDRKVLRQGFLVTLQLVSLIIVPLSLGMCLLAPEFVELFYTVRWMPAAPVMQALSIYSLFNLLDAQANLIYKSIDRLGIANLIGIIKVLLAIPVLWIAAGHSIFAVAVSQVFISSIIAFVQFMVVSRLIDVQAAQIWESFKPSITGAGIMVPGVLALNFFMKSSTPLTRMAALTGWGALLYFSALWFIHRKLVLQAFDVLRKREKPS